MYKCFETSPRFLTRVFVSTLITYNNEVEHFKPLTPHLETTGTKGAIIHGLRFTPFTLSTCLEK